MKSYLFLLFLLLSLSSNSQSKVLWEFKTNSGVYSSGVSDDNALYIGSNDSSFYSLNKSTGKLIWKFNTKGEIRSKALIVNEKVVFNSSDGFVYALNKVSGEEVWKFKTQGENRKDIWDYYLSSPKLYNSSVIFGSGDSRVYSIDVNSGKLVWSFKTDDIVHASPLIQNDKVFIGSFDGYFYCLNAKTGKEIWKFNTIGDRYFPKGAIQKSAIIYKDAVIFGSRDYNIYALNTETGSGLWNMKEKGSWIISTPLLLNETLYFGTSDTHRFLTMDANTGYEKHNFPLNMRVYGEAVNYNDNIIFGCFNGKLYKLNSSDSSLVEVFQTKGSKENYYKIYSEKDEFKEGFNLYGSDYIKSEKEILSLGSILSTPLVDGDVVYIADSNGILYALGEIY